MFYFLKVVVGLMMQFPSFIILTFSSITVIEIFPQLLGESWDTKVMDRCLYNCSCREN